MSVKQKYLSDKWSFGSSKPWEQQTALGANHLPILSEPSQMSHKKYEGQNFNLGHPIYTQNKAHFLNFTSEI
jgi:hypothetical protein